MASAHFGRPGRAAPVDGVRPHPDRQHDPGNAPERRRRGLRVRDRVDVGFHRDIGLAMDGQHVCDHLADATEADDHGAPSIGIRLGSGGQFAAARFDPTRDDPACLGEQRGDGQADRGHRLPEGCGGGQDQLRLRGGGEDDQGRLRGTAHQQPRLRRYPGPRIGDAQQERGDDRLGRLDGQRGVLDDRLVFGRQAVVGLAVDEE